MKVQSTIIAFSGLVSLASALPAVRRDSSTNEPAVEAPNGTPITLTYGSAPTGYDDSDSSSSNYYSDSNDVSNNYGSYDTSSMYDASYNTWTMTDDATSTSVCDSCTMTAEATSTSMCDSCTMTAEATSTSMCDSCTMTTEATSTSMCDSCTMTAEATSTSMCDSCTMTAEATSTSMCDSCTMAAEATSTSMYDNSYTTSMWESTADATSTWTSSSSYATYGSGYTSSGYDNCVQQCMASYAPPPSMVTATPSYPPSGDDNSSGSGATLTVIVAPTQGVLRYVPFAVNASVGDTVRFLWGAGPHTVTQSSQFNLCNATTDPFKSGAQNKSFVFDQVVNSTDTVFYYCGIPTHCEKGMFGMINPPNAEPAASTTAQSMLTSMAANNSDVAAQWSYTMMTIQNSTAATNWGSNIDISQITNDPDGQLALIQNVMYTRLAIAANPQFVQADGSFNPNIAAGMAVPMDPTKLIANGTSTSSNSSSSSSTSSGTSAPATTSTSGALRRVASSATGVFAAVMIAALVL